MWEHIPSLRREIIGTNMFSSFSIDRREPTYVSSQELKREFLLKKLLKINDSIIVHHDSPFTRLLAEGHTRNRIKMSSEKNKKALFVQWRNKQ